MRTTIKDALGLPRRVGTGSASGFTLLEVLVALVVLGFLVLALAQGVRFGLAAWSAQRRGIDRYSDLDAVDRTLRGLITHMDPGTARDPGVVEGSEHTLLFTALLPGGGPAGPDPMLADMALGVGAGQRLVLRWVPHLHARRIRPPPEPRSTVLLEHVAGLNLAYLERGGSWVRGWTSPSPGTSPTPAPSAATAPPEATPVPATPVPPAPVQIPPAKGLPALVRIHLDFAPNAGAAGERPWPDIVAAPVLDPAPP